MLEQKPWFGVGKWAPCVYCRGMTKARNWGGEPAHTFCHTVGHDGHRTGPNRHDHKRAGTVPDRSYRPPQPAQFTASEIAEFRANVALMQWPS